MLEHRIDAVEAIPFRLPSRRDFRWAGLQVDLGSFVLVRVHTDRGLRGHGEATPLPDWGGDHDRHGGETLATVGHLVTDVLGPALVGRDPLAIEANVAAMDAVLRGNTYAKAAVDMALHDLSGRILGIPAHRLLGGPVRDRVAIAHMVGLMPFDDAVSEAKGAVDDGVRALQIKGGVDADRDVALVTELRAQLGPQVLLRLDANQGYRRAKDAHAILSRLPPGVLDWVEQPVEGVVEMAEAVRRLDVPVLADESCWTPSDAAEVAAARAADGLSIYLAKAGGIAKARRVAAIAAINLLPCDVNGSIESGVGNAANVAFALAALPVTLASVIPVSAPTGEHPWTVAGHYYDDDIIDAPMRVENGAILAPDRPGLGFDVDDTKLARYRIDHLS